MPLEDVETSRKIRTELTRRYFDSSGLEVHVIHGVVHINGIMRPLRTHPDVDMKHEQELLSQILRVKPGIREVIWEATIRS